MTNNVFETLNVIFRDDLSVANVTATRHSRLVDDLGLDSLAFAIGVVAIEERLGVALTERELLACQTVGELETVIVAKRNST